MEKISHLIYGANYVDRLVQCIILKRNIKKFEVFQIFEKIKHKMRMWTHSSCCSSWLECIGLCCDLLNISTCLLLSSYNSILSPQPLLSHMSWPIKASDWLMLNTGICAAAVGWKMHDCVDGGYRCFHGVAMFQASCDFSFCSVAFVIVANVLISSNFTVYPVLALC